MTPTLFVCEYLPVLLIKRLCVAVFLLIELQFLDVLKETYSIFCLGLHKKFTFHAYSEQFRMVMAEYIFIFKMVKM